MLTVLKSQPGVECDLNHILLGSCKKMRRWYFLWCFSISVKAELPLRKTIKWIQKLFINHSGISK